MDYSPLLLRTDRDVAEFERRMGAQLLPYSERCFRWLTGMPMQQWFCPLSGVTSENDRKDIIQMICWLYVKGHINVSCNETAEFWIIHPMSGKGIDK